jgi:sugar-specific transcriptional regulator TrmB
VEIKEEEFNLLIRLGFTQTQAKLYLTLLRMKRADGRTLSRQANLPSAEVYRTLDELQRKGLVDKEITQPYTFRATPIEYGLQMLILQKVEECKEIQEITKDFLRKLKDDQVVEDIEEQKYRFVMIDRKERIIQKMRQQHDNVQHTAEILSNPQRWLLILQYCWENYEKALERGVQYRVVIESSKKGIYSQKTVKTLLAKPNFELRLSRSPLPASAALFDRKEATFALYPSQALAGSPVIWTNQPSFLTLLIEHFENVWKHSRRFKVQNKRAEKKENGSTHLQSKNERSSQFNSTQSIT